MSAELEEAAAQEQQQEIQTEPTLGEIADQTIETAATEASKIGKSLVEQCYDKLKAHKPLTVTSARALQKEIIAELKEEGVASCDRANVYRAVRKLEGEGFFNNGGEPIATETFSGKIKEMQLTKLPRLDAGEELSASSFTQTPPPTGTETQPPTEQPPKTYEIPQVPQYNKEKVGKMFTRLFDKAAQVLDAPSLAMGKEEAEDTAEAALIIFSSNGQIDPRYLAAGTLAVNLAPRLISALPKVVAKVTKKKNVSGKT